MDIQFDNGIKPGRFPILSWLTSRQLLGSAGMCVACVFLSFATNSFATSNNIFNVTRNFTFVAVVRAGHDDRDHHRGIDLSVGSVLCLCSMILAVVMHAGYSIEVGIVAALGTALLIGAINGVLIAYLGMPPFVVTLWDVVDRAQPGDGRIQQHRGVPVRAGSGQALFPRRRALLFGIANPSHLYARARASDRIPAALHQIRPLRLRHRGNEHAAIVTACRCAAPRSSSI